MKYIVILGDGMADEPIEKLGGRTPLEYAKTDEMDRLARMSEIGMVKTIPDGMKPGSDVANLAVLGYDPKKYYSGRSPLEALSIGAPMTDKDVAIRCNIVTISDEKDIPFEEHTIIDHSSDEISTEDCKVLLDAVRKELESDEYRFYLGTSYRHCLIWKGGNVVELTPPHDVLTQKIGQYLPEDKVLREMMKKSYDILKDHPLNKERIAKGLHPANCCWFWGAGTKPALTSFEKKTGKKGMMISAVDLLKGIATGAEMGVAHVEGANGGLNTNYEGKAQAALDALLKQGYDFAYVHLEAPDEMGHQGSAEKKVQSIEYLDKRIIAPVCKGLDASGEPYRMLIMPDHPTPVRLRTHVADPIPYMIFDSTDKQDHDQHYNEREAAMTGNKVDEGYRMIDRLFSK